MSAKNFIKTRGTTQPAAVVETPAQPSRLEHFRAMVRIDRNALDLCAEEQPQLFLDVANEHVLAQSRQAEAKDALLRVDARLGRETRAKMEKESAKPTEGKVADVVLGDEEHIAAADKLAACSREVDDWGALRSALEHRKSMIRELATLFAAGYYTAGVSAGAGNKARDASAAAGREAMADKRGSKS